MSDQRPIEVDEPEIIETTDVVVRERVALTDMGLDVMLKLADQAEKRVDAMTKMRLASIRRTNKNDWVDQGGKPYLQSSGGEKIADLWGISWKIIGQEKALDDDGGYIWSMSLRLTTPWGREIDILGTRSSRDTFFCRRGGEVLPISQIDEAAIRKSSYTNALARGVQIILGLRNMTWEELEENGIGRSGVASVKRNTQAEASDDEKTKQQEIWQILTEMTAGDTKAAIDRLEEMTAFKGRDGTDVAGVRVLTKLRGKRLDVTLGKARDAVKEFEELTLTDQSVGDSLD